MHSAHKTNICHLCQLFFLHIIPVLLSAKKGFVRGESQTIIMTIDSDIKGRIPKSQKLSSFNL